MDILHSSEFWIWFSPIYLSFFNRRVLKWHTGNILFTFNLLIIINIRKSINFSNAEFSNISKTALTIHVIVVNYFRHSWSLMMTLFWKKIWINSTNRVDSRCQRCLNLKLNRIMILLIKLKFELKTEMNQFNFIINSNEINEVYRLCDKVILWIFVEFSGSKPS